jgi:hypothetical protein
VTEADSVDVANVDELDHRLDAIEAEAHRTGLPLAVSLTSSKGEGTLDIVVGAPRSWLHHVPADGMPPYRVSHGDEDIDKPFTFYVDGDHHTEGNWWDTIPVDAAREAARYFLRTGELDGRITWVEV